MTDIRKSDAQLDAEAAGRWGLSWHNAEPDDRPTDSVAVLIHKHRIYYSRDLEIYQLADDEPPVFTDPETGKRSADPMSMMGPTLSWPLTSYIADAYGLTFPWSRAAFVQWVNCRRVHPAHQDRPEFEGSLCRRLVVLVIRQGFSIDRACLKIGLTPERAAPVLRSALLGIDAEIRRQRAKADFRQMEDEGYFVRQNSQGRYLWDEPIPEHHSVPGLHQEDCPQCLRRRANAA